MHTLWLALVVAKWFMDEKSFSVNNPLSTLVLCVTCMTRGIFVVPFAVFFLLFFFSSFSCFSALDFLLFLSSFFGTRRLFFRARLTHRWRRYAGNHFQTLFLCFVRSKTFVLIKTTWKSLSCNFFILFFSVFRRCRDKTIFFFSATTSTTIRWMSVCFSLIKLGATTDCHRARTLNS